MPPARSPRKRARDLDRVKACGALDAAFADGQIGAAEHRTRAAAAMSATTIDELHALVADLQVPQDLEILSGRLTATPRSTESSAKSWTSSLTKPVPQGAFARLAFGFRRIVVLIIVCVVVMTIFQLTTTPAEPEPAPRAPAIPVDAPDAEPGVVPRVVAPVALHTSDGLRGLVDAVRAEFGTTMVAKAAIYSKFAYIDIPAPGAPDRLQSFRYRGGFAQSSDAGSRDPNGPLVDLATVDPDAILALLAGADESLNVTNPTDRSLLVRDGGFGPEVLISLRSTDSRQSGILAVRPDGTVIAVHPAPR